MRYADDDETHAAGAGYFVLAERIKGMQTTLGVSAHMLAMNSGHRSIVKAALDAIVDYDDYDYDYDDDGY